MKSYLDKKGAQTRFKDNLPTRRFVESFLKRHPTFTFRKANPIKRSRAMLSREEVSKLFKNFEVSVAGIPPENIYNFDETNLRDDPGVKKCIFKKGTKYCGKVQNTSKQAISVMMCGPAKWPMVPPMVAYKAQNLYTSWCERGPKGAVYTCSKSGWFGMFEFEKWFKDLLLPILKCKVGKKLIIGDNLAAHISGCDRSLQR